jgi:hypothetical protein
MEHPQTTDTIRQNVMQSIARGTARMRPAWHFALLTALWSLGIVLAFCTLVLVVALITFSLRQSGASSMPPLGLRALGPMISTVPWLLVFLGALFVVILELLTRHFAFAYRRPLLLSLIVVIALALVGGITFSRAPMHHQLFERAMRNDLPLAGPMYRRYGMGGDSRIHPGIIASVQNDGLMLTTRRGASMWVAMSDTTQVDETLLVVGMPVVVLGDRDGASISAVGIMPAPGDILWGPSPSGNPAPFMHQPRKR